MTLKTTYKCTDGNVSKSIEANDAEEAVVEFAEVWVDGFPMELTVTVSEEGKPDRVFDCDIEYDPHAYALERIEGEGQEEI